MGLRTSLTFATRISLEAGGNAPFIVFNDADIDEAVECTCAIARFMTLPMPHSCDFVQVPRDRTNLRLRKSNLCTVICVR